MYEVEVDSSKIADSCCCSNKRVSSRPRRIVAPLELYYDRLFLDVEGESCEVALSSGENPILRSEDSTSDRVQEIEDTCTNVLVKQTISSTSKLLTGAATEIFNKTMTFIEDEVYETMISLSPSILEDSDHSDISSKLICQNVVYLKQLLPESQN